MAVKVTANSSNWKLHDTDPLSAYREWLVTGVSTEATALAAVDATDTSENGVVAQRGASHPFAPTKLFSTGPFVVKRSKGNYAWTIGANFIQASGEIPPNPGNPLLEPTKIRWNEVTVCEEVDLDLDGRPIVGPNGEPIGGITREVTYYQLYLTKNFPSWNTALNSAFVNATNSASITVPSVSGPVTIAVQHMRSTGYAPVEEYTATAPYLRMCAKFDVFLDDSLGLYPFQSRVMAQGSQGFSSDGKGPFVGPDGNPVGGPVKLQSDGNVKNVDGNSRLKVLKADGTTAATAANPGSAWTAASSLTPGSDGTVYILDSNANATIGYFKRARPVNLLPFLSLF